MDLRLLIPENYIDTFIQWFLSEQDRETTYDREFNEELVSLIPHTKQAIFNKIRTQKQVNGSFDIFFDEEKGIKSIKPMDIVSIDLTAEQKHIIYDICAHNSNLVLATKEEILYGYKTLKDNTVVKIGGHTKNILPPQIQTLEL